MEFYTEPEHKLPVTDHADVIVAGAGPAGYTAAIAGREQKRFSSNSSTASAEWRPAA